MSQGSSSPQPKTAGRGLRLKNSAYLSNLMTWFIAEDSIFGGIEFHGNTSWLARELVTLALCWAWSSAEHVTDAFDEAVGWCDKLLKASPLTSYTGFMGAMTKWSTVFIDRLVPVLHARMQEIGQKFWRSRKWVLIAFDGSRATAPRTKSNEAAFCANNYGFGKTATYRNKNHKKNKNSRRRKKVIAAKRQAKRAKTRANIKAAQAARRKKLEEARAKKEKHSATQAPQSWITMMWQVDLRLPWSWRLGPSNSSERDHVMQMLEQGTFPKNTLFLGDAGFIGYQFWSAIVRKGQQFLVRVGANVSLLTESADVEIQEDGLVLCWPKDSIRANHAPLRLRLIKVLIGKTKVYLLTSVLNPMDLTKEDALVYYKKRWGIEIEFRGLKQTLDRGDLRCDNAQRLLVELNWSILAMAVAELFALKEQLSKKQAKRKRGAPSYNPIKRSLAKTIRALRKCLKALSEIPEPYEDLTTKLRNAVTDSYLRKSSKKPRHRPANPDKKPLGDPKVRQMTSKEVEKLRTMEEAA